MVRGRNSVPSMMVLCDPSGVVGRGYAWGGINVCDPFRVGLRAAVLGINVCYASQAVEYMHDLERTNVCDPFRVGEEFNTLPVFLSKVGIPVSTLTGSQILELAGVGHSILKGSQTSSRNSHQPRNSVN